MDAIQQAAKITRDNYARKTIERYGAISKLLQTNSTLDILESLADVLRDDNEAELASRIESLINEIDSNPSKFERGE